MKNIIKVISLTTDFAVGFHACPAIEWLTSIIQNWYAGESLFTEGQLDFHLVVAFIVMLEAIHSYFLHHLGLNNTIELTFDFAKGFHVWPAISWSIIALQSLYNNEQSINTAIDLHLVIAFVVMVEAIHSLCKNYHSHTLNKD